MGQVRSASQNGQSKRQESFITSLHFLLSENLEIDRNKTER